MFKAERMQAMGNTPTTGRGVVKCWDFNANSTCHRGAKCPNTHENFTGKNLHWAPMCELIRRGCHKKGKLVEASEINGRVQQRREQNQREHGEKIVDGKLRTDGYIAETKQLAKVEDTLALTSGNRR